jgi:hypothetical protein
VWKIAEEKKKPRWRAALASNCSSKTFVQFAGNKTDSPSVKTYRYLFGVVLVGLLAGEAGFVAAPVVVGFLTGVVPPAGAGTPDCVL